MKSIIKNLTLAAMIAIAFTSCSKKNDSSPNSASSSWNFNGTSYAAATTVFTNNALLSIAKDNSQETIGINFNSRPAAGTYTVVNRNVGSGQCTIQITGTGNRAYVSQGGGTVSVAVNNGKVHATFTAVPMNDVTAQAVGNISGDLTEQ